MFTTTSAPPLTDGQIAANLALTETRLAAATKFTMRYECFFSTILLGLVKQSRPGLGTMGTNGTNLIYDPNAVCDWTQSKVSFVVLHEILHVVSKHHLRRGSRDPHVWNNAGDYFINALLVRMGIPASFSDDDFRKASRDWLLDYCKRHARPEYVMPEDGLFRPELLGMSTEDIYALLVEEEADNPPPPPDGPGGSCPDGPPTDRPGDGEGPSVPSDDDGDDGTGGSDDEDKEDTGKADDGEGQGGDCPWGQVYDAVNEDGGTLNPKELAEAERKLLHDVTTAANIAKGRGQLPAWLDELIEELKSPSQDWAEVLRDMLADTIPNDFSFERLNRMHLDSDIVMPSNDREGLGHVGIFTDASGSVTESEFVQFCSEWREISEELQPETMTLIQFDSKAGEPEVVERGDDPTYKRGHSGGTRFSAPFEKAEKLGILDDFDVIIVFTDGGDDTYPEEPDCPVIWATTGAFWGGPPPFGECVQVKFNR